MNRRTALVALTAPIVAPLLPAAPVAGQLMWINVAELTGILPPSDFDDAAFITGIRRSGTLSFDLHFGSNTEVRWDAELNVLPEVIRG